MLATRGDFFISLSIVYIRGCCEFRRRREESGRGNYAENYLRGGLCRRIVARFVNSK